MRIYLRTTPNDVIVPFDYQQKIVGTIHKWLGNNEIHDKISLYSFSWTSTPSASFPSYPLIHSHLHNSHKGYHFPSHDEKKDKYHKEYGLRTIQSVARLPIPANS